MSRYIDADKFIKWLDIGHYRSPSDLCYSEENVRTMIEMQPTVEAAPVSGRWVKYHVSGLVCCSNCGHEIHTDEKSNFCPNCGADMR